MPNSVLLLDIGGHSVKAELQLPLNELELAFGHDVNRHSEGLVQRLGPQLNTYLLQHMHPASMDGKKWTIQISSMQVQPVQQSMSGPYNELTVQLMLLPPENETPRHFMLNYDVIIHQVVTHFALVSVRQDWDNAQTAGHPYQVAAIRMNTVDNKLYPVEINVQEGALWTGFTNMVSLGMNHIKEGTDHLLFLLTLLLPATLTVKNRRWNGFGGTKRSLTNILKIVTAFTIGHSVTLIIGALGVVHFPGQIIEVLIALSILVSAVHALKPIFPGKELYIAGGFGLIHGMAFAESLINLNLDGLRMMLSILGFNLGIELMQILIIAIIIPWLIILSRNNAYAGLRIIGSVVAAIAALAWMTERISGEPNIISSMVTNAAEYSFWIIPVLAIAAFGSYVVVSKKQTSKHIGVDI
ncbi:HupE/UreJ family protein [Mucilaginibacter robiniae]|uniref:HupE/UreJ family protein n=2 Tax=Mucilaginibacter robiniae TaxID=2728022 RepID=A0A7L5E556_9SPHI|nr:HupE/UreJ family protein [Mucilaginibacter robiniae]